MTTSFPSVFIYYDYGWLSAQLLFLSGRFLREHFQQQVGCQTFRDESARHAPAMHTSQLMFVNIIVCIIITSGFRRVINHLSMSFLAQRFPRRGLTIRQSNSLQDPDPAPLPRVPNVQFRVLIIGRANAGKTSILQRVCYTTESPVIYRSSPSGARKRVCARSQWRLPSQSHHDPSRSNSPPLQRLDAHILPATAER